MRDNYFVQYLPLLLHFLVAFAVAAGMVTLSTILGYRRPSKLKSQAYECGITPTGDTRGRFSVKFYLVGMLFILFDVEADLKMFGFWEMFVYVAIFLVGFFYVWKKGVLDWSARASAERGRV